MILVIERTQRHMATDFEFHVSVPAPRKSQAEDALRIGHMKCRQLEKELSEFIETSPISQLNAAKINEKIQVSTAAIELLKRAHYLSSVTEGSFEVTAKSGIRLADGIGWCEKTLTAWKKTADAHVGFGAIGKGYALDEVRKVLEQYGFQNYLLSAGGSSILISGFRAPEEPWEWDWGVRKDSDGEFYGYNFVHSSGIPVALGISGCQEQKDHLLDPESTQSVKVDTSALVAHPSATDADALATAFYLSGWEKSLENFEGLETPPAMAMSESSGETRWNGIFSELWGSPTVSKAVAFFFGVFSSATVWADEVIDLSNLGMNDFLPYEVERNPWWLALPIFMALFLLVHIQKVNKPDPYAIEEGENDESAQELADDRSLISVRKDDEGG